jgi:hypothetical protein
MSSGISIYPTLHFHILHNIPTEPPQSSIVNLLAGFTPVFQVFTFPPGVYFQVIVGLGAMQYDPPANIYEQGVKIANVWTHRSPIISHLLGLYEPS